MPLSISSNTSVRWTPFSRRRMPDRSFQSQSDARKFAARSDLVQRARLFAGIGRNQELDAVGAVLGPAAGLNFNPEDRVFERQRSEFFCHFFGQLLGRGLAPLGQGRGRVRDKPRSPAPFAVPA